MRETMNEVCTDAELGRLSRLFVALAEGLQDYAGTSVALGAPRAARGDEVVVGRGSVHIAFHLTFEQASGTRRGCLLLPLQDALGLTARHRQLDGTSLGEVWGRSKPEAEDKEQLLALGHCLAAALAELDGAASTGQDTVSFLGCQGVRAGLHPHVPREPGEEWLVGRASARLDPWDEFDVIAMVPPAATGRAPGEQTRAEGDGPGDDDAQPSNSAAA